MLAGALRCFASEHSLRSVSRSFSLRRNADLREEMMTDEEMLPRGAALDQALRPLEKGT